MVYIGEDVEHGGYYLVTENLVSKHPHRVRDFPPDETSLLGAGAGLAQAGLLPVVEVPYAKYLDCAYDLFTELAVAAWLSNGRQPAGMLLRLQGFGRGVFGGNYHTHNSLPLPPGVDVVCYSTGADAAAGLRFLALQASRGRVVMTVDSTHLLPQRHLTGADDRLRLPATDPAELLPWDAVRVYGDPASAAATVVTYGEGVGAALEAAAGMGADTEVAVVDCPLLSRVPRGLEEALRGVETVVFADPCKGRGGPLASHAVWLHRRQRRRWGAVGAEDAYNPLGNTVTFVNAEDIRREVERVLQME
jgi:pyruvate/2-oxoglutarate/acetoin dehydrogenase E1 component